MNKILTFLGNALALVLFLLFTITIEPLILFLGGIGGIIFYICLAGVLVFSLCRWIVGIFIKLKQMWG